ncbi:hypothetical protein PspLS_09436 [Pyricularia sp. CBS 133598]|nr:hypothetical protein PspLS_09436 [Pyricularia sp. CBS 133598]
MKFHDILTTAAITLALMPNAVVGSKKVEEDSAQCQVMHIDDAEDVDEPLATIRVPRTGGTATFSTFKIDVAKGCGRGHKASGTIGKGRRAIIIPPYGLGYGAIITDDHPNGLQ